MGRRRREAAKEAVGELRDAEARASKDEGDEIDAEFNRRVLEHLRSRAEEAKRNGPQTQTERGNAILKALCEKLKAQLEVEASPPSGAEATAADVTPGPGCIAEEQAAVENCERKK